MQTFDSFFFSVFQYYKPKFKQKANTIALFYISSLQCALLLLSGIVLAFFLKQMHTNTISSSKAWTLFFLVSIFIYFKNWIQYSGRKRKILNAKSNKSKHTLYNIWLLWLLLLGSISLSLILLRA